MGLRHLKGPLGVVVCTHALSHRPPTHLLPYPSHHQFFDFIVLPLFMSFAAALPAVEPLLAQV